MNTRPIRLEISLEELNKILTGLGNLPYIQVYELVIKIQQQAETQLQEKTVRSNGLSHEIVNS